MSPHSQYFWNLGLLMWKMHEYVFILLKIVNRFEGILGYTPRCSGYQAKEGKSSCVLHVFHSRALASFLVNLTWESLMFGAILLVELFSAARLAARSARLLPRIPTWLGMWRKVISLPCWVRFFNFRRISKWMWKLCLGLLVS